MRDFGVSNHVKSDAAARNGLLMVAVPGGLLVIISLIFIRWDLDRNIAARFYSPETGWYLKEVQPWLWLYRYGTIPGIALTLIAIIGAVIARLRIPEKQWHHYFLLVVLTSVIGAGILVNGILKPYWGRPRPNQIQELGGQYPYRNVFSPGIPGKGKSFPSGHASMGFLFVSLVYFRRKSAAIAWIGGIGGFAYGTALSITRVVQGAHFVTDCMWSLGVIWLVASTLYYFVLMIPTRERKVQPIFSRRQKQSIAVFAFLLSVAIVFASLTRRPFFETYYFHLGHLKPEVRELRVGLENGYTRAYIRYSDRHPLLVLIHARGFAWIRSHETPGIVSTQSSGSIHQAVYRMEKQGYFSELNHEIEVVVPTRLRDKLTVVFMDKTE